MEPPPPHFNERGGCGAQDEEEEQISQLLAQLAHAATVPPPGSLPPGTADVAWQACELVLSGIRTHDMEARRAHVKRLLSAAQPRIDAEKTQGFRLDDRVSLDEMTALYYLKIAIMAACGSAGVWSDELLPWFMTESLTDQVNATCVCQFASSARLQQLVKLLGDPAATARDRAGAANTFLVNTFCFFVSAPHKDEDVSRAELLEQLLVHSGFISAFGAAQLASVPTSCALEDDGLWLEFNCYGNILQGMLSNALKACKEEGVPERYGEICRRFIDSGCGTALCRYIEMFAQSDVAKDHLIIPW